MACPCDVWGVLNVTDDSFSDGGRFLDPERALSHARTMALEGASVIDVGGESTRPAGPAYGAGYSRVSEEEELRRVIPVIERISRELEVAISIDTTKPGVARAAILAGARIVNDVSLGRNEELFDVVAAGNASLVLMHTRGNGEIATPNTTYDDVVGDTIAELMVVVDKAREHGIARERIWIDPGIGFAKTAEQSAKLLANLGRFVATGYPVLVGASRKSFIAQLCPRPDGSRCPPFEREAGTAVAVAASIRGGAQAVRVHDVAAARQAAMLAQCLRSFESANARDAS